MPAAHAELLQHQQRATASPGCVPHQLLLSRVTAATSAEPNLSHLATQPCAGSPACSHCWQGATGSGGLSSSTGRLVKCAGWGCAWCGTGTRARCAHRCFPDQGSHTLFWPLPSLLSLQPIESFVSLKSRFLTLQIIRSSLPTVSYQH